MKRDEVLARKILSILESHPNEFSSFNLNIPGYDPSLVKFHITLMIGAKYILPGDPVDDFEHHSETYPLKISITWKGCDYLEGKNTDDE